MNKRIVSLILATMLAMIFVACDGTDDVIETSTQIEDNEEVENIVSEGVFQKESESEEIEETIVESDHDVSEEFAGDIFCENGDFTIKVKKIDGYTISYWGYDEESYVTRYRQDNDTIYVDYNLYEGNIDELYVNDFESVYDPSGTKWHEQGENYIRKFEINKFVNDDGENVYYFQVNQNYTGNIEGDHYTWMCLYKQLDDNHYICLNIATKEQDEDGFMMNPDEYLELTKDCYFIVE